MNAIDADGLVSRQRDPANRRIQQVALTGAGEAAVQRMRLAAVAFDQQLGDGLSTSDLAAARRILDRLRDNLDGAQPTHSLNEPAARRRQEIAGRRRGP
ncbi:MAG TPA: hypothetical protein VMU65_01830 [Candidatus Saccharimonadales bacterium]|nr:hypothetical protein [Candidatus Saccharimonadales bacterium]